MEDDIAGRWASVAESSNVNFTTANLILDFHNTSTAQWDITEQELVTSLDNDHEQTYRNFTTSVQVFIFIASLLGNSLVLWSTCHTTILKSVTSRLLSNLACSGVCASLVCLPCDMALSVDSRCCWRLMPLLLCKFVKFLHKLFCSVTVLTFAAIAVDRYYSVLYPLERKISDAKSRDMIIYIWAHGVVASVPVFAVSNVVDIYAISTCTEAHSYSLGYVVYTVAYNVTTMALPLCVVFSSLVLIRRALSASQKKKAVVAALRTPQSGTPIPYVSQREAELHAILLSMVAIFVACSVPYMALVAYHLSSSSSGDVPASLLLTAIWLPKISLLANPLLFLALNRAARRGLLGALAQLHRRYSRRNAVGVGGVADAGGAEPAGVRSGSQLLEMFHVGQQQIFRQSEEDEEVNAPPAEPPEGSGEEPRQPQQRAGKGAAVQVSTVSSPYGCANSASQVAPVMSPEVMGDRYNGQVGCGPFELPPQWLSETRSSKRRLLPPLGTTPEELIQTKQPRPRPERRISRNNRVSTFPLAEP